MEVEITITEQRPVAKRLIQHSAHEAFGTLRQQRPGIYNGHAEHNAWLP